MKTILLDRYSLIRKKAFRFFLALFCIVASFEISPAQSFVHPGIPFTRTDLNLLKVNITQEPWLSAYNAFANDYRSKLTYGMQGPYTVVGRAQDINRGPWQNDMIAVHNLAFMWIFTGDTAYAKLATSILDAWAVTNIRWTGDETFLDLGDYAPYYITGADILKSTYPGWTATNTAHVNNYFANVLWPEVDVPNPVRGLNQGAIQLKIALGLAAFLDDPVKWAQALDVYRSDAGGGLACSLPNGQVGDAGRDEGHWFGEVEALAWCAEVAWKQGTDMFAELDNRILATSELYTRYNVDTTGLKSRFIPFGGSYSYYTGYGTNGGARRSSYLYNIIKAAYPLRKNIPAPYTDAFSNLVPENTTSFLFRKSADNSTATVLNPIVLPATVPVTNLTNIDVGAVGLAGSAAYDAGTWTVKGAGADIPVPALTTPDAFNYTFQQVTGDAVMIARVTTIGNTDADARAGIMFRESLAADARHVGIFLQPGGTANLTWRGATAWSKTNISWNNPPAGYLPHYGPVAPWWLKLERRGNRISAYHSVDGINWTCLGIVVSPMPGAVYVGLCATSHNTSALSTSTFTNVSITHTSPAGSPVITNTNTITATIGAAFSDTITATNNPVSYAATGLPRGLSVDSNTGVISGSADTLGKFVVTVSATNAQGTGKAILILNVVSDTPPVAPVGVSITNEATNQNKLTWNAVANATSYTVKRALTTGGPYTVIATGVTGVSFTDANAYPGHNYYVVTALSGTLESAASAEATILLPPSIPAKPEVVNHNGQVSLTWPAALGATTYHVKRSAVSGGTYSVIATGITTTSYTDAGLTNGSYYYYVISSELDALESANSPEELAVPGASTGTWSMAPASGAWNTASNWIGGNVPVTPAILNFKASATTTLTNDITGLQIPRITFDSTAPAYTIDGNAITLGSDIINNSAQLQTINTAITLNNPLQVNSAAVLLGGTISGAGSITKAGPGILYIKNVNTYAGNTVIYGTAGGWPPSTGIGVAGIGTGTSGVPASGPLGNGKIIMNGGSLFSDGAAVMYNDVVITDNVKSYFYQANGGLTFFGRLTGSGTIENDGNVTGGLHLVGDNSGFTGTFISVNRSSNHRIRFDNAASGSANANWVFNNGFTDGQGLAFGIATIHFGAMSGSGSIRNDAAGPSTLSIGALNTNTAFTGVIQGNVAITKVGTGTFEMTGNHTFYGITTIEGGSFLLGNDPASGAFVSPVTTVTGIFGGTGRSTGPVTIGTGTGTGAILAPGKQGIGTLTIGALTMYPDARYQVEMNMGDTTCDKVNASSVILNNAQLVLTAVDTDSLLPGVVFTIINNTGNSAVTGTFKDLPELALVTVNGYHFRITYKGGTGNDVQLLDNRTLPAVISSPTADTTVRGRTFSYTITAVNAPGSFNATGLPAGLNIDTITGIIAGRPTISGVYPVAISATGPTGTGTATLTLTIVSDTVTALIAASGDAKVVLDWDPIQGMNYRIKRATVSGGPYTVLGQSTVNRFVDAGVVNGTTYYYVVAAYDSDGEHPTSAVVVANPTISQWAYYRFNENSGTRAIDNWGGNHAVLSTTATRNAGYEGQALVLDGAASSYATLPGGVLRNLNDFTISTWVKMDALATWMRIFDFGSGTNQYMFLTPQAGVTSGQSIIRYAIKNGGSEQTVNFNYTWPLDTWTHIAITQSGNTCRLYLNGVLVATNTNINIKPAALDSTTQNYLGKSQFAADPMLKGRIDEVKMYSRALSSAEIVAGMKAEQIITFDAIPAKRVGDADFAVTASASSGLQLTYSSSDTAVATVDTTGLIHITGAGATIITTSQYGNAVYDTAVAFQPFTVQNLDIQVQHMDGDNGLVANNSIRPYLKIVNKDSIPVAYQELTVRYWFTAENYAGINTWIDYAQLGSNVKMKYVALPVPRNGAFGYLEYSFETAAGNLPAGGNSGVIQSRVANTNWAVFAETDDYSYAPNATYTANSKITLYRNGRLVWGSEPVEVIPTVNLKVYAQSINSSQNTISNYLKINNEGNMPVDYGDISVRYWFTAEGTAALNYWIDYAQLGASRISGRFTRLSPVRDSADTYLEITVDTTMGALFPLSTTGNIQYRITKSDWSNFISNNDFSWMAPTSTFNENSRITIHYKGELIWGREPAGSLDAATMRSIAVMNNDLPETGNILVYPNPVADILHIRIGKPEKDGWISIYNNSGVLVHSERLISGTQNIPVTRLVPGIYHVQIRNGKAVTVKKIIKE